MAALTCCCLQMGAVMMKTGAYNTLTLMSQEEGRHMDSPESVKVRGVQWQCTVCTVLRHPLRLAQL